MDLSGIPMEKEEFGGSPAAIIIGSESHGMGNLAANACDKHLRIRMPGNAESLNAAIAAGIAMYYITNYEDSAGT
jgi:23S rRNA (guanosine2251-2'-O)-methyltransferase